MPATVHDHVKMDTCGKPIYMMSVAICLILPHPVRHTCTHEWSIKAHTHICMRTSSVRDEYDLQVFRRRPRKPSSVHRHAAREQCGQRRCQDLAVGRAEVATMQDCDTTRRHGRRSCIRLSHSVLMSAHICPSPSVVQCAITSFHIPHLHR